MIVDEIFSSPESMAESLLRNWRWQWFYEHKELLPRKDYDDIRKLDSDLPDNLQEQYRQKYFGLAEQNSEHLEKVKLGLLVD